ncbi:MAG: DUF2752 domain-containing protein [Pyrinomonadaceae bacterium]
MSLSASKTRLVSGLCGAAALASLAVLRIVARADESAVFFAGRELHWSCPLKQLLGVPCPSCGMTRSVLLTLGGDWRGALSLNPGGPVFVFGIILLSAMLLLSSLKTPVRADSPHAPAWSRPAFWAASYGCVWAAVVLVHWIGGIA